MRTDAATRLRQLKAEKDAAYKAAKQADLDGAKYEQIAWVIKTIKDYIDGLRDRPSTVGVDIDTLFKFVIAELDAILRKFQPERDIAIARHDKAWDAFSTAQQRWEKAEECFYRNEPFED